MKILIGADSFTPDINGAARFTERLAQGLAGRGHEVHVTCTSPDGRPRIEHRDGLTLHRLHSIHYRKHETLRICLPWETLPQTRELVGRLQPDVVHVQSHMVIGRGLAYAAERHQRPLIATNHFMPENVLGYVPIPRRMHQWAGRLAWRDLAAVFARADLITAPTPRAVDLLSSATGLTAEPVSCGIDADRYWQATRDAESAVAAAGGGPMILFVGRLDQEKRINELIMAFARLPESTGATLEIIGNGDQRTALQQLAVEQRVADRVIFHGHVSDDQLLAAYGRASIFCMPGIAELQSIVTLESMAAGKPVVAANAMALPHLVRPGYNGWLFTPGDVGELALRLSTLVSDSELRTRMGQHSREIVANHDFEATLDRFEDLYHQVGTGRVPLTQVA
jgi:glycosyltransferase involved in cell wall biosynthesis